MQHKRGGLLIFRGMHKRACDRIKHAPRNLLLAKAHLMTKQPRIITFTGDSKTIIQLDSSSIYQQVINTKYWCRQPRTGLICLLFSWLSNYGLALKARVWQLCLPHRITLCRLLAEAVV